MIEGLDDKFWVWETLEEATRPHLDSLDKDESKQFLFAFVNQLKGSDEFIDLVETRYVYHHAEFPNFTALTGGLKAADGSYNQPLDGTTQHH